MLVTHHPLAVTVSRCYTESMANHPTTPRENIMARTRKVQVTISDEEYSEMLRVRLAAKHGFEAGTVSEEEYNQARAVVRNARKVRKAEGAVVENYRQQSAPQHAAMTRKPAVQVAA